ncbi:MAG: efflux RND transporter periplasmic adaptor subunit, partial [Candidatus Eisenbacteria bacterium]
MNANFTSSRTIGLAAAGILLFVVGLGAGHLLTRDPGDHARDQAAAAETGNKQLYTCGMHPNVIQEGPGICPICNMDLVPVRKETGGGTGKERKIKYWVAPMDPAYISDKPGKSPMGMDLVPVYEDEAESGRAITIDPAVVRNIGVRTAHVERGPLKKTIRATGLVAEDETRVGTVSLKIEGWIEKVYVDETGQAVRKGDPLVEIDSPRLANTQQEYLIALDNLRHLEQGAPAEIVNAARETLESTRRRLLYWSSTDEQVADLERTREVGRTMTLRSPFSGVVTMKNVLPGARVAPGMDIYHIADLGVVWVQASVFDADLPFVSLGQPAAMTLSFLPGRAFEGKVAFLSPVLDPMTRDLKIRLEFPNEKGDLKPGMYADVRIESVLDEDAVLVPAEAVIRSGKRDVVFVARGEGRFMPAEVRLGPSGSGGVTQVLDGVLPGERVVTSAQFLLDSESSFREAVKKMMEGSAAASRTAAVDHPSHAESPAASGASGDL